MRGGAVCGAGGCDEWAGRLKGPSRLAGRGDMSVAPVHALAPWSSSAAANRPLP